MLNAVPDTREQQLRRALEEANDRADRAEQMLREERKRTAAVEAGAGELRNVLAPLYRGLQRIFGEIDAMDLDLDGAAPAAAVNPRVAQVWQSWKEKLGGLNAKAIDVLLLHGGMTTANLRIHLRCAFRTAQNVGQKLVSTGIARREGGKIFLREL